MRRLINLVVVLLLVALCSLSNAQHQRPSEPGALLKHAREHFSRQEFREALDDYLELRRIAPKTPTIKTYIGECYAMLGDRKKGRFYIEAATIDQPKNSSVWQSLAWLESAGKNHRAAEKAARRAVKIDPKNRWGWFLLAISQGNLNQNDSAMFSLRKAYSLDQSFLNVILNSDFGPLAKSREFKSFIYLAQQGQPVNQKIELAPCPTCLGRGESTCSYCTGSGQSSCISCGGTGRGNGFDGSCTNCSGSGRQRCSASCNYGKVRCSTCGGSGAVPIKR